MDTPKPLQKSAHLLDDLESIRQLLGDDNLQPPLLTDTVDEGEQEQIPMLFDTVSAPAPTVEPKAPAPAAEPAPSASKGADALLHLDSELRRRAIDHAGRDRRLRAAHRNRNQTPLECADGTVAEPVQRLNNLRQARLCGACLLAMAS
jgi:hypothetical protein